MIAVWECDIADALLIPRLNCPIDRTLLNLGASYSRYEAVMVHSLDPRLLDILSGLLQK